MRTLAIMTTVVLAISSVAAQEVAKTRRVENATAGVSLEPPPGWRSATVDELAANRAKVRVSDAELEQAFKKGVTPALFAFTKHPEPYDDINPSIQIMMRPAPEGLTSANQLLDLTADALGKAHKDFKIIEPVHETEVGGLPGAAMKISYTLRTTEGGEFKILGRTWAVKRGNFLILVGMSGSQEGADVSEEEFAAAFRSLKIQP